MRLWITFLLLWLALPALAQESPDRPRFGAIRYDETLGGSITDAAFFDRYRLEVNVGDLVVVEVRASNGLSPLVALLDPAGDALVRSDETRPPSPNDLAVLQHRATEAGDYFVLVTREGTESGETTGNYELSVILAEEAPERENPLLEVEFRCDELLVSNALEITFSDAPNALDGEGGVLEFYRLTVFGLEGFKPVIRVQSVGEDTRLDCSDNGDQVPGSRYDVPAFGTLTIPPDAPTDDYAQLQLRNTVTNAEDAPTFGVLRASIGSSNGNRGRYLAVLEGLELQHTDDIDEVILRLGPLAQDGELLVYMIGDNLTSRLDPRLIIRDANTEVRYWCDDAGRTSRDERASCEDVPRIDRAVVALQNMIEIAADRFDAGGWVETDSTDPILLDLASRARDTDGAYTLFFIGAFPGE